LPKFETIGTCPKLQKFPKGTFGTLGVRVRGALHYIPSFNFLNPSSRSNPNFLRLKKVNKKIKCETWNFIV